MIQPPLPFFKPESPWRPPTALHPLESVIALDMETHDPDLTTKGAGFKRGEGKAIGIALADKSKQLYLPIAHRGGDNLDRKIVLSYVERIVANATEIIMANAQYDLGWLETLGIRVSCPVRDIQVAEALLNEERYSYSLDNLAKDHLKKAKDENELRKAASAFADSTNQSFNPKHDMWKLPARFVGTYAETDARLTYDIYQKQIPLLREQNLWKVWELECELIPCLSYMSRMGVPVDQAAAEKLRDELVAEETRLLDEFDHLDIWSTDQVAEYLISHGITVPTTKKGNHSVTKNFLANASNPLCRNLLNLRELNRLRKVYVEDTALAGTYKGRIHADFKQTASDDGGTRSGRLSSANPNMQQVPKRSAWGKRIRQLYVAEPHTQWCKADYSSQEPRLQVHYGIILGLAGAQEARQAFIDGVKLYTFFEKVTGLPYDTCKMLCLGISYGMGKKKMAETLGVSEAECGAILHKFDTKAPFLRQMFDRLMTSAQHRGYIKTILGRRSRFDKWALEYTDEKGDFQSELFDSFEKARKEKAKKPDARGPQRAFTSKALNRLIQGSAADQSKLALVAAYKAGLDVRLPVHDEINIMARTPKDIKLLKEIMENVLTLEVPVVADIDVGPTWC